MKNAKEGLTTFGKLAKGDKFTYLSMPYKKVDANAAINRATKIAVTMEPGRKVVKDA